MNKKTERKHNLKLVIETLRRQGGMTQARLKEHCGLQASTVSYLVNDLKRSNLVKDIGPAAESRVGKPGSLVGLNNGEAQFLGIYVEDDGLHSYRIGIDGSVLACDSAEYCKAGIEEVIERTIRANLDSHSELRGVGLAIKAIVYNDGTIKSGLRHQANNQVTSWNFTGLANRLRESFPQTPIIVENDANCVGELYHYENKLQNGNLVVYLLNKTPFGIGCGLILNGEIYRGASGAAGEFFLQNAGKLLETPGSGGPRDYAGGLVPAIMPHIMGVAHLLDPDCVVLTGSYFEEGAENGRADMQHLLANVPAPVVLATGEGRLNPAKGVALLATNSYIARFVEEVLQR